MHEDRQNSVTRSSWRVKLEKRVVHTGFGSGILFEDCARLQAKGAGASLAIVMGQPVDDLGI